MDAGIINPEWPKEKYSTIVIDPPWPISGYQTRGYTNSGVSIIKDGIGTKVISGREDLNYETMSITDIALIDIPSICNNDAFVFIWTINTFIEETYHILKGWGLDHIFTMAWIKPHGAKPSGYPIYNMEHILVGKVGKPKFLDTKDFRLANRWDHLYQHSILEGKLKIVPSGKPAGFYDTLRRVSPEPRIDIFARRWIAGFTPWGNQVKQFEGIQDNLL